MKKILTLSLLILMILITACNEKKEEKKTEIISEEKTELTTEKSNPKYVVDYLGIWSGVDNYPIIEITFSNNEFNIRECYGLDATKGLTYKGNYENDQIVAKGKEADYYKATLPTFELLENGKIKYMSGADNLELSKSNEKMPNINYSEPNYGN